MALGAVDIAIICAMTLAGGFLGFVVARWLSLHLFPSKFKVDAEAFEDSASAEGGDNRNPSEETATPTKRPTPTGGKVINGRFVPSKVPLEKSIMHNELEKRKQKENVESYEDVSPPTKQLSSKINKGIKVRQKQSKPTLPGMADYDSSEEIETSSTVKQAVSKAASKAIAAKERAAAKAKVATETAKTVKTFLLPSMEVFDAEYEKQEYTKEDAAQRKAVELRALRLKKQKTLEAVGRQREQAEREASERERLVAAEQRHADESVHGILDAGLASTRIELTKKRIQKELKEENELKKMLEATRAINTKVAKQRQLGKNPLLSTAGSGAGSSGNSQGTVAGSGTGLVNGSLRERQAQMRAQMKESEVKYTPKSYEESIRRVKVGLRAVGSL
jgi:hypothetical protein